MSHYRVLKGQTLLSLQAHTSITAAPTDQEVSSEIGYCYNQDREATPQEIFHKFLLNFHSRSNKNLIEDESSSWRSVTRPNFTACRAPTPTSRLRRHYLSVPPRRIAFFERFVVNNGWDLGVWCAKSFYAEVLKCGPRPFALAEATDRCNKGCDGTLHQYSGGLEGSHHTQARGHIRQRYKQQNRASKRKWEGGSAEGRDYMSYQ